MTNENVGSVILDGRWYGGGVGDADKTTYDNTTSGLTATNVQDAIDSNAEHIGGLGNVIGMRGWNQLVKNGKIDSTENFLCTNGSISLSNNELSYVSNENTSNKEVHYTGLTSLVSGHKYYMSFYYASAINFNLQAIDRSYDVSASNSWARKDIIGTYTDSAYSTTYWYNYNGVSSWTVNLKNFMCIDLTALFGSGNEPTTVAEFRTMFPADYYPYCSGSWADLLWTNPNPSATFGAGNITFNFSGYSHLMIVSKIIATNSYYMKSIITLPFAEMMNFGIEENYWRVVNPIVATNTLEFADGQKQTAIGTGTVDNDKIVPYQIYGIK